MLIQLFYTYSRFSLIKLQLRHFAKHHDLASKHCHTFPVLLRRIRCFEACHDSAWHLFHWFFACFAIAILVMKETTLGTKAGITFTETLDDADFADYIVLLSQRNGDSQS